MGGGDLSPGLNIHKILNPQFTKFALHKVTIYSLYPFKVLGRMVIFEIFKPRKNIERQVKIHIRLRLNKFKYFIFYFRNPG
jgi:hypothetical protein